MSTPERRLRRPRVEPTERQASIEGRRGTTARVSLRSWLRRFGRLAGQTVRWLAVVVAVLVWLVVVPLVELVTSIVGWLVRRVQTLLRRGP
jgi:hypothetical protein